MHTLTVTANQPDGAVLRRITFDHAVPGHVVAGQFVTVQIDGIKPGFFAIASSPGQPVELLVKPAGPAAEHVAGLLPGAVVSVSDGMGKGFGLDLGDTRPLVVLVNGSGLSAVLALVEDELSRGLPRPVHVLYGVLTPAHAAYPERLDAWQKAGVDVELVLDAPVDGWDGPTGFVQHRAQARGLVSAGNVAVLVGYPGMIEETRRLFAEAGAAPEQVRTNF